ncbi:MAG: hypothetical protein CBD79_00320 [Gammaproteobacteria bacterium TMED219]|nr:MAG: hypothetical protein CBD79_00320 [Gammaproteobacteria bacterium TMED219]
MKVYRYILSRSFASVLGVLFIITSIDLVFNFFSQLEDINENYSYADVLVFLLQSQPFRSREFIYLCSVVGLLVVFLDNNFLRAFNSMRQAGLKKINFALLAFLPIVIINLASYEYLVPDLTKSAFVERKAKVNQIMKEEPKMVEIRKVENAYQIISEDISVNFSRTGDIELITENAEAFKSLNYNSNLKYLRSSELVASSGSAFENYNLIVQTELLRRSLNFLSYFFIFIIGLEILLSFNKGFNTNRILIYGFGTCLLYSFLETLIADSITVFGLPFYLQAFPVLFIPIYLYLKRFVFF